MVDVVKALQDGAKEVDLWGELPLHGTDERPWMLDDIRNFVDETSRKAGHLRARVGKVNATCEEGRLEALENFAKKSTDAHESLLETLTAIHDQLANLGGLARNHDERISALEVLVKRIAARLEIEG